MKATRRRYRIFLKLEKYMEIPMFFLALFWLYLFAVELFGKLTPLQEKLIIIIWILFIFEFLIKLIIAPRRLSFLKHSWLTILSLILPALRVFRLINAFRLLQSVRVMNSAKVVRAITSGNRFILSLKKVQGPDPEPVMNVGICIATASLIESDFLVNFSEKIAELSKPVIEEGTGIKWKFEITDIVKLQNSNSKLPSEFLDIASLRMGEEAFDMFYVITDVPLLSGKNQREAGLASPVSRIGIISLRNLLPKGKSKALLSEDMSFVYKNGALLLLHLTGHLLGLKDTSAVKSKIMGAKDFTTEKNRLPNFSESEKRHLYKSAHHAPDREIIGGNFFERLLFHILMTLRHPLEFLKPLLSFRIFFMSLSLSGLVTAAVAPALLLIFTAEIWDVGLGMDNVTAVIFALLSIVCASLYLVHIQSLFLPRRENTVITEHLAVANSTILLSVFIACLGLFFMLAGLMFLIEIYIFPSGLMQTWPTLDRPVVTIYDKLRLAAFISTIGVTTGALAGGLESKAILKHLTFFKARV